jgi:non-specific serine/threonine protein kinase
LSQAALAERAGLGVATLRALERDRRQRPHHNTLARLAEALDLTPVERGALLELATAVAEPPVGADGASAPVGSPPARLVRLPLPATVLIGRDAEVAEASALLDPATCVTRLLVLVGPAGVGKTRLALAVAAQLVDCYPDGVVFVDLAHLRDERLVAATIARALELREVGGHSARDLLIEHLRGRAVLLVLDNLEHLLGAAPLLAELLAACPRLALLVTSRIALRLRAEQRLFVEPLTTPSADTATLEEVAASPAVRLFVARTQAVAPAFGLEPANAAAIAAVCRRLDGMPLAIELAAARMPLLSPAALLRRLEHRFGAHATDAAGSQPNSGGTLPLLVGGAADLPERQQTLRQTLAWSFDLLGPTEQVLLRRLAVFAGGWTLEAAESVCTDTELPAGELLDRLQKLLDSSLVQTQVRGPNNIDGESRFGLLETVREFADEQLGLADEREVTRARHAGWYIGWAEQAAPELTGRRQQIWFLNLSDELANFRAVRDWCHADPSRGQAELRLAAALGRYWWMRTPGEEARQWLTAALFAGPTEPTAPLARTLTWCGLLDYLHDTHIGRARLQEAVEVARAVGHPSLLCLTLRHVALYAADPPTAQVLLEEAARLAQTAGDQRELAMARSYLARARESQGDFAGAYDYATQAVTAARVAGDAIALADALLKLGNLSIARQEYDAAARALQEALELSERLGYHGFMTPVTRQLAYLALVQRDLPLARVRIQASLQTARAWWWRESSGSGADGLRPLQLAAHLAVAEGRYPLGVSLFGAVAAIQGRRDLHPNNTLWTRWALPGAEAALMACRDALGEADLAAAWSAGQRLSLEDALDQALEAFGD